MGNRKALIGPHGGFNVGCIAMLLNEFVDGAVNVQVVNH